MAATMKAVRFSAYGGPEVVSYEDVPRPQVGEGEVLVRVLATSVNPVDWKTREGGFRTMRDYPMPFVPGWDAAGVVDELGEGTQGFRPGDLVYALPGVRGGAFAEYVAVPASAAAPKPTPLSFEQAASLPLAALTAWQGLFVHGGLQPGQRVLIHAAAGGVGSQAVQYAHAKGAHVTATASGEGVAFVRGLGADEVIDYKKTAFETVAHDMDVVLDLLGGETQERSWSTLKRGGVLVCTLGQPPAEKADAAGVRAVGFGVKADGGQLREIGTLFDAGQARALVDRVLPLAEAGQALELSKTGRVRGKIVLRVAEDGNPAA